MVRHSYQSQCPKSKTGAPVASQSNYTGTAVVAATNLVDLKLNFPGATSTQTEVQFDRI